MFIYWIYFDRTGRPEKVIVKNLMELHEQLAILTQRNGEMPEWIQRVYK